MKKHTEARLEDGRGAPVAQGLWCPEGVEVVEQRCHVASAVMGERGHGATFSIAFCAILTGASSRFV